MEDGCDKRLTEICDEAKPKESARLAVLWQKEYQDLSLGGASLAARRNRILRQQMADPTETMAPVLEPQQPAEAAEESPTTQELKLEMGRQLNRLLALPEGDFRGRAKLRGKCCQKDRALEGRVAEAMTQEIEERKLFSAWQLNCLVYAGAATVKTPQR